MSTVQGVGKQFYGWRHNPDGTSTATSWFVLFFLPVLPLGRYSVRVLTDFRKREPFLVVPKQGFFAGYPTGIQLDYYEILNRTRLVPREVVRTVLMTYVAGPILMAWPLGLFLLFGRLMDAHPQWRDATWPVYAAVAFAVLLLANAITVPLIALRRARGFRGGLFE